MNTGQMLLVVGAFSLLSSSGLSVNRVLLENDVIVAEAKAGCTAVLVAQGRISEVAAEPFDSLAVGARKDTAAAGLETVICSTHVGFVTLGAPDSVVAGPTGLKRVRVTVWSEGMPGRIGLTGIVGAF